MAALAWQRYGTRPPLRTLCVLPAVRAAGGGFRRRRGALCAGRCTLGRLFGHRDAARPRTCRYVIAHGMTDKVHVTNSWQSSRACPVLMLLVLCMGWNFDAVSMRDKTQDGRHMHRRNILACHTALLNHIRVLRVIALSPVLEKSTYSGMPHTNKSHSEIFRKHMPHDAELNLKSLIHQHTACLQQLMIRASYAGALARFFERSVSQHHNPTRCCAGPQSCTWGMCG